MIEKVKSCLLTGALGDAYGRRFERPDLPAIEDTWKFTDEFSYLIATCNSISQEQGVHPEKIAAAMRQGYMHQQLSGLKTETLKALTELVEGQHWESVGKEGEAEGNSPALRIAPLAFVLDPLQEADQSAIRTVCEITHNQQDAYAGALAVVCSIRFIQNNQQSFLHRVIGNLPESKVKDKLLEMEQTSGMRLRDVGRQFGCSNAMADSVPFSIYAAQQSAEIGLETMMNEIVAAGGDTHGNCTIAGFIAGAHSALDAIPGHWMEKLKKTEHFDDYYQEILDFASYVQAQSGIQTLF